MKRFSQVLLCGAIVLLSLECGQAANGHRPRSGVVGTFGTLNSSQQRPTASQSSRRTSLSGSGGSSRMSGSRNMGGVPGMGGMQGGGLQGKTGLTGQPNMNALTGASGMTGSASPTRHTSGRPSQGSPINLTGSSRSSNRKSPSVSVRSRLPPANSQR